MPTGRRARSWVDAVVALIDRLPGPPWVAYAILVVLSVAATVILRLLDGVYINPLVIVYAALTFTPFAVAHYINQAARRALARSWCTRSPITRRWIAQSRGPSLRR